VSDKNSQFSGLVLEFATIHVPDEIPAAGCVEAPKGEVRQPQKLVVAAQPGAQLGPRLRFVFAHLVPLFNW
jgi:hypothetical protein